MKVLAGVVTEAGALATVTDLMAEELAALQELTALGQRKTASLVQGDTAELTAITRAEHIVLQRLDQLAAQTGQVLGALADELGLPAASLTASRLAELDPEQFGQSYQTLRPGLQACLEAIDRQNTVNAELLVQGMELVQFTLQALGAAAAAPAPGYSPAGALASGGVPARRLNQRA